MFERFNIKEIDVYLEQLCDRLREAVIVLPGEETVPVRLSGGYVVYPEVNRGYRELMHLADQAMYQAKKNGKGHIEKYYKP